MRHYLDQYVRLAAENFEKELTRVAGFDEQAKTILANSELQLFLKNIDTGKIKATLNNPCLSAPRLRIPA